MTVEEFKEKFYAELAAIVELERPKLPRDTGRLQEELFKLTRTADGFKISIDTTSWQYPYWINQVGYRTAGYWEITVNNIINNIINKYGGQIQ
jgi:hypothetical protein